MKNKIILEDYKQAVNKHLLIFSDYNYSLREAEIDGFLLEVYYNANFSTIEAAKDIIRMKEKINKEKEVEN